MSEQPKGPSRDAAAGGGDSSGPGPTAPPQGSAEPSGPSGGRPDYHVYRSRGGVMSRLGLGDRLRLPRRRGGGPPKERRGVTPALVAKIVLGLAALWILLSVALFFISAQTTRGVSERTERALSGDGNLLTGATILVLGSDERPQRLQEQLIELGQDPGEGGRADSILLFNVALGEVRKLSIPRDTFANIPGAESQKINAAYFIGGAPLMIETVEQFMGNGLTIDHIIEVNFANFPDLIDALGGVEVTVEDEICAPGYEGNAAGVNLEPGDHNLGGQEALEFARVRNNPCSPEEDDLDRAARQQEVFSGIRSQLLSPSTFFRLPWASWAAPRAIKTDLRGPGLAMVVADLITGGTGDTNVLEPTGPPNSDGSLPISEEARAQAVDELTGGE
jgi:LCP family protein required for cell wall assembly